MRYIALVVCISLYISTLGCTTCSGGIMGSANGISPLLQKHYIGLSWASAYSNREHTGLILTEDGVSKTKYHFNSVTLSGAYSPTNRLQIQAKLPYIVNVRRDFETNRQSGIGDAQVLLHYTVFTNLDSLTKKFKHRVAIGAGVELPTGKFAATNENLVDDAVYQTGSGSTDIVFNANYLLAVKNWRLMYQFSYQINTTNKTEYKFGNQLTNNVNVAYLVSKNDFTVMPFVGILSERLSQDVSNNFYQQYTGGSGLHNNVGVKMNYKKWALQSGFSYPLWQKYSNGIAQSNGRFYTNLNYYFK